MFGHSRGPEIKFPAAQAAAGASLFFWFWKTTCPFEQKGCFLLIFVQFFVNICEYLANIRQYLLLYGTAYVPTMAAAAAAEVAEAPLSAPEEAREPQDIVQCRLSDLSASSVRDLRYLAQRLNIDVSQCLEKSEMVQQMLSSGLLEVIRNHDSQ